MAVVRARSAPPYALILFVVLWVVSTILAVVFYLKAASAQDEITKKDKDLVNLVGPADRQYATELQTQKVGNASTAMGIAREQINALKNAIGAPDHPVPEIVGPNGLISQALVNAGFAPQGQLLPAFQTASARLRAETDANKRLTGNLDALRKQVDADKQNYDAAAAAANQAADAAKGQLSSATGATAAADAARQSAIADYEKKFSDIRDQQEAERRQQVLQVEQLKDQNNQLQTRISALQDELDRVRPSNNTNVGKEPAGKIVRAAAGTGEVYISLGRKDHITPGLTFAVYDPQSGVRFDNDAEAAGKGSIEVMAIGDTESLCRVTKTTKGQAIQSGDLIANPVYQHDRNRQFHFVVVGDFDLDGDGVATPGERDRLLRLVKSWGGVIDDKVTTQTDFLVAGSRPAAPVIAADAATAGSLADERAKLQQSYDDTIAEAKRSTVPILNANRFLAMIGYNNTTVVR